MTQLNFIASQGQSVQGDIRIPGDKSISHRAIMLGAIAEGVSEITGFLEGQDALATINAFRSMGVTIEGPVDGKVRVYGVGMHGLKAPEQVIDLGNSGTSIRLLSGLLAGQAFSLTMTGDESLVKRPMRRVTQPLALMGASMETAEGGTPPLTLKGSQTLKAIDYVLPMASAQVKSCVLLAGLYAQGKTTVTEPAPTRDHTERMLKAFGYEVQVNGNQVSLQGGGQLSACHIDVPGDISSAAFFMVAAAIMPGSDLLLRHVGINPTRIGVLTILRLMGAKIELLNERVVGGEPVADLRIQGSQLAGITIPEDQVPLAIDEFPVLFIAAACAKGRTVLTGAHELRVKESDRIAVMEQGLKSLGVNATATDDGMIIEGGDILGGEVYSHHDHRISMSFAVASLVAKAPITIHGCDNVATSFPNFVALARQVGFDIDEQRQ